MSKNSLNASIPPEIGNLVTLQTLLDLSYNSLTGKISPQIGKLLRLENLNLSHNNFFSTIPSSLGDMVSLVTIDLSYNDLEGPLPNTDAFRSFPPQSFANNKDLCGEIQGLRACNTSSPESTSQKKENSRLIVIIITSSVALLLFVFLVVGTVALYHRRCKRNAQGSGLRTNKKNLFSIWNFNGRMM